MTMVEMACDGAVVRLTMNAPDRLNALSDEMLAALQARLDEIAHRPDIRVVILAGAVSYTHLRLPTILLV